MGYWRFDIDDGKEPMDFERFILSESIRPKYTQFGTDLSNSKWVTDSVSRFTFFRINNITYCVVIDTNNSVGFMTTDRDVDVQDIQHSSDFITYGLHFGKRDTSLFLDVFEKVLYVICEGISHLNLDNIRFNGASPALSRVYERLVTNKYFLQELENRGFRYRGLIDKYYVFSNKTISDTVLKYL